MVGVNSCIIVGVVDREPRVMDAGRSRKASFTVVVPVCIRQDDGTTKEFNDFVSVQAWGRTAEQVEHIAPGTWVAVDGSFRSESYDDRDNPGKKKYVSYVNARSVRVGGSRQAPPAPHQSSQQHGDYGLPVRDDGRSQQQMSQAYPPPGSQTDIPF